MREPKHKHDCDHCRFLGTYEGVDHYYHPGTAGNRQVALIRRYSSEGPDYDSFPCYAGLPSEDAALLNMPSKWVLTLRLARVHHEGYLMGLGVALALEVQLGAAGL